eukprot:Gb_39216 [translate_table: standard]
MSKAGMKERPAWQVDTGQAHGIACGYVYGPTWFCVIVCSSDSTDLVEETFLRSPEIYWRIDQGTCNLEIRIAKELVRSEIMAVTHADLAIGRSSRSLGSKLGTSVMLLCTVLGLLAFVFCLIAETTRSEATWMFVEYPKRKTSAGEEEMELKCMYTSNGRTTLMCASGAFLSLGIAWGIEQAYMWIALCNPPSTEPLRPLSAWASNAPSVKSLTIQAAFFFVSSWICYAVAAVLLVIGIAVEATHIGNASMARNKCLVIREGLFAAAGVFGLSTTSLGVAFYVTALQTLRVQEAEANVRQEVLEAGFFSDSPPWRSMDELPQSHPIANLNSNTQQEETTPAYSETLDQGFLKPLQLP